MLRQGGDDVLSNAFGNIFLIGIVAHVLEWKHRDRRSAAPFERVRTACLRDDGRRSLALVTWLSRLGAVALDVADETKPFAGVGLDERLLLAAVADRTARRG